MTWIEKRFFEKKQIFQTAKTEIPGRDLRIKRKSRWYFMPLDALQHTQSALGKNFGRAQSIHRMFGGAVILRTLEPHRHSSCPDIPRSLSDMLMDVTRHMATRRLLTMNLGGL